MEKDTISKAVSDEPFSNEKESPRTMGDRYRLEKEQIKFEIGDLEQIRISLGYSQRRMCQLLLVDPSAWTRWTKSLSGAPPHIYQALKWLVELKNINPDAVAPSNLAKRMDFVQSSTQAQLKEIESNIASLERVVALTPSHSTSDLGIESILREQEAKWEQRFALLKLQFETALNFTKKKIKKAKGKRVQTKRRKKSKGSKRKMKVKTKRKVKTKKRRRIRR